MTQRTTISVDSEVRDKIRAMKVGGETYTDVIERMIKQYDCEEGHG